MPHRRAGTSSVLLCAPIAIGVLVVNLVGCGDPELRSASDDLDQGADTVDVIGDTAIDAMDQDADDFHPADPPPIEDPTPDPADDHDSHEDSDDPEPDIPPECAEVTCNNGGSCVVVEGTGVCDCPAGTLGLTCQTLCEPFLLTPTSCTTLDGDCLALFSEDSPVGIHGDCASGDVRCVYDDDECQGGCVRFDIFVNLGAASWVPEIWWRADWWAKRPSRLSVAASDMGNFGTLRPVAELEGHVNPWQCINGEACTEEVPDECCPDGRDAPQRIDEGALIPLWDIGRFEADRAQFWRFTVEETYQRDYVDLLQVRFYGTDCPPGVRVPGPPMVVSTVPEDGATIRFTAGAFNPSEVNRLIVTFDRGVFATGTAELPLTATAEQTDGDFSQALEVRPRQGADDPAVLVFDSAGTAYTSFPGGEYAVTIQNVRSLEGRVALDSFTWAFTARACGDGTCDPDESTCTCSADCGACAGCCRYDGGAAPDTSCQPGTSNDECGKDGASCGVCVSPDVCAEDGAGCL